jgi:hypothetical protein
MNNRWHINSTQYFSVKKNRSTDNS